MFYGSRMQTNKLTDEQLISEVVKQLEAKGTRASVEYPTHVFVEPNFAFGITDGEWSGNTTDAHAIGIELRLPSADCRDASVVADAILHAINRKEVA